MKTFDYDYMASTVAGTEYTVSNAKINCFGLTSTDTVEGFTIREIAGNNTIVYSNPRYISELDEFMFKPDAGNTVHVRFRGVVFYSVTTTIA